MQSQTTSTAEHKARPPLRKSSVRHREAARIIPILGSGSGSGE